jgi:hypothetical protein
VIELWAVEAFCLSPVIACLFFVVGVLSMLEMQDHHEDILTFLYMGPFFAGFTIFLYLYSS